MAGLVPFQKKAETGLEGVTGFDSDHPWVDHIVGGNAEGADPNQFDLEQLAEGVKEEMEHTSDPNVAAEIAMDHLIQDPDYYKKLKLVEAAGQEKEERVAKVAAAKQAGITLAHQLMKEAGLFNNAGQMLSQAGKAIGASLARKAPMAIPTRGGFHMPAGKTMVRAPSPALLSSATRGVGPKKIGLGKAGLLGAAGLGAYGLTKAIPWAAQAAKEEGSMPMAAGGGWSPVPYGYGYTPWGNAAPNMGAL